jgi:hypothetical protein
MKSCLVITVSKGCLIEAIAKNLHEDFTLLLRDLDWEFNEEVITKIPVIEEAHEVNNILLLCQQTHSEFET